MGIKILLFGAFFAVSNASSIFACDGCGCRADVSGDHQHTDKGYMQADMEYGFAGGQSESLAQCAIEMFGNLEGERMKLTAKAEGGCDHSKKSLRAEEIKSIKEMLSALSNSESRRLMALGMMIGSNEDSEILIETEGGAKVESTVEEDVPVSDTPEYEAILSDAEEILEARLEMLTALELQ